MFHFRRRLNAYKRLFSLILLIYLMVFQFFNKVLKKCVFCLFTAKIYSNVDFFLMWIVKKRVTQRSFDVKVNGAYYVFNIFKINNNAAQLVLKIFSFFVKWHYIKMLHNIILYWVIYYGYTIITILRLFHLLSLTV